MTKRSGGNARFAQACASCPLAGRSTDSPKAAPSPWATPRPNSLAPAPAATIGPVPPTTALPAPKSNANSAISCAADTADGEPECGARPRSPLTPTSSWPPPT